MIQSYKKPLSLEEHYHVIIKGTGIGSFPTGDILAKEGKKVLL